MNLPLLGTYTGVTIDWGDGTGPDFGWLQADGPSGTQYKVYGAHAFARPGAGPFRRTGG